MIKNISFKIPNHPSGNLLTPCYSSVGFDSLLPAGPSSCWFLSFAMSGYTPPHPALDRAPASYATLLNILIAHDLILTILLAIFLFLFLFLFYYQVQNDCLCYHSWFVLIFPYHFFRVGCRYLKLSVVSKVLYWLAYDISQVLFFSFRVWWTWGLSDFQFRWKFDWNFGLTHWHWKCQTSIFSSLHSGNHWSFLLS